MGCLGLRQVVSELLKEVEYFDKKKTAYLIDRASDDISTQLNVGRAA